MTAALRQRLMQHHTEERYICSKICDGLKLNLTHQANLFGFVFGVGCGWVNFHSDFMTNNERGPAYTFHEIQGKRLSLQRGLFAGLAVGIVIYVVWLLLSGIFIFPLCAHCPIEALWAVLWVLAVLSTVYVGYFAYRDIATSEGLLHYSRGRRIAVRIGYGISALIALVWFVLLIVYASVFTSVGTNAYHTVSLNGIKGEIQIGVGKNAVMQVIAEDEFDLAYGLGWGHATFRLFQMEIQRRAGRGRLSEVVGDGGLDVDKFMLTTGFYDSAQRTIANLDPHVLAICQAYVKGINDFIRGNFRHALGFTLLGFKAKPDFTVADVITFSKMVSQTLSSNWDHEVGRLQDHILRSVSGSRLSQFSPMQPQDTVTVISDEAMGDRYAHIPPSNHRNVSLEYEVDRLDAFLETAGFFPPVQVAAQAKRLYEQENKRDLDLEEEMQNEMENEVYLRDLIGMLSLKNTRDIYGPKPREESGSVVLRAQKAFPSLFSAGRGFKKASNNWVVHGSRTMTGKPILANDPHLTLTLPSVWLVAALNTSKHFSIGTTFPGLPSIIIGRNNDITWGVTNSGMDVQDLYVMDEVSVNTYRHNGQVKQYRWRMETIPVKGKKAVSWPVRESLYGPVINPLYQEDGDLKHSVSVKWPTLEANDTTMEAFYALSLSKNWTDFRTALSKFIAPAQNFVYADLEGNIGYQLPGPIPVRVEGHTGTYPVPGNGSFDWIRYTDFWNESLWVLNPPEGYIASANNMVATQKYPFNILNDRDWEAPYRAIRIKQLVDSPYKARMTDMQNAQIDTVNLFGLDFVKTWRYLSELKEAAEYWATTMVTWDGNETPGSRAALAINSLWAEMVTLAKPETGIPWQNPVYWINMVTNATYPDPICAKDDYNCGITIGKAFNVGLKQRRVTQKTKKSWGSQHNTVLTNPIFANSSVKCLFQRKRQSGGSHWTVNVAIYDIVNFDTIEGPSYRQVIDVANWDDSVYVLPGGPSEIIVSQYADSYKDWADGNYLSLTTEDTFKDAKILLKPKD